MFIRANNGHVRIRNGSTAVGCGFKMPKNIYFHVPSGNRVTFGEGVNVDKIIKDIKSINITIPTKKEPRKYIRF